MGNRSRAIADGAVLAAMTVMLILFPRYVPVPGISLLIGLAAPLPVAAAFLRHGLRTATLTALVAGVLLVLLVGPVQGILNGLFIGCVGLGLGWTRHRGLSFVPSTLVTALANLVFLLFNAGWLRLFTGEDVVVAPIARSYDLAMALYPQVAAHLPAAVAAPIWQVLRFFRPWVVALAWAMLAVAVTFMAGVIVLAANWVTERLGVRT